MFPQYSNTHGDNIAILQKLFVLRNIFLMYRQLYGLGHFFILLKASQLGMPNHLTLGL